jgi:hypothetical protein
LRSRSLAGLVLACGVALLAPLLVPLLTGRVFVYNDLSWFHLPLRYLYHEALQAGDTVLWTPAIFAGFYLHGEGQGGLFHPFHQLLYRIFSLSTAFNLEVIVNYPIAFAGMYFLLRRLRLSGTASLFGALLFAFSGFNLLHYHHVNMIAVVAHLPWLLVAADVLIVDKGRRAQTFAFAAVALIVGSELLLGFPQAVWWNLLMLGAFGLLRGLDTGRWLWLVPCAAGVAFGVLIGAIQLLPTLDSAAHSMRASLTRDFALTYSLHPINLFQMWSPYAFTRGAHSVGDYMWFHEFGIYSGAILPVALLWTSMRRRALVEHRVLIMWAAAVAAIALVLALGRYGGLAVALTYVPGLESLRAPVRYILFTQFALAILSAVMLDDLRAISDGRRERPTRVETLALFVPLMLGIVTTVALNGRLLPFGRHIFAGALAAAPGVAIAGVVAGLVALAARRARWAIAALILVTAADLGAWGYRFIFREAPRTIEELTAAIPPAPAAPAEAYAAGPLNGPYKANVLVLRGYRLTNGYVGLFPATQLPLDGERTRLLSGTRWVFTEDGARHAIANGAPRVGLIDGRGLEASGSARLVVDRPGYLVVDVDAPGWRRLALTERFHHGWSLTIDGVAQPTARVNGDFLGSAVEPGAHRVEFRFAPGSFTRGAMVSAVGLTLLLGIVAVRLR